MKQTPAPPATPTKEASSSTQSEEKSQSSLFVAMALDMSWRLAVVVLIPLIGGFKLDEHFKTTPLLTILGFILAMTGMGVVMWQTVQTANQATVTKKEDK